MQSDFTNVETELRDIENAFATGRMNAFGSASTQDAFVHELRRIAEIETQVFYRTCALLKSSNTNGHNLVTNMYASAQPPPQSQRTAASNNNGNFGDSSFRGSSTTLDSSMLYRSGASPSSAAPRSGYTSVAPFAMSGNGRSSMASPGMSRPQSRHGRESATPSTFGATNESTLATTTAAPHLRQSEWVNEDGFADKAFEDVAAHFDELELQFTSLGDYLREISKHVILLNDMSEQVNSGTSGGGGGLLSANSVSFSGNNQSTVQPSSSGGRRMRNDSFDEEARGALRFDGTSS
jgi:hypothetical protein